MPIQWGNPQVLERVYAATIASMGKVDIQEIARLYGKGMTYNALECHLRKIKKLAVELKAEAVGREVPAASPARPARKSPVKQVKTGRVTKSKGKAKSSTITVKKEPLIDEEDQLSDTLQDEVKQSVVENEEEDYM